jgi:predicted RNA-binding protein (virulence factor B family)
VAAVLPDGKVELSLRVVAHEAIAGDADHILSVLRGKDAPQLGDHSSPEEIRAAFGLSKKAWKRAAGRLLRTGAARVDSNGVLRPSARKPAR